MPENLSEEIVPPKYGEIIIKEGAQNVTPKDIQKVISRSEDLQEIQCQRSAGAL
ncbi:MAG: hypothetical protein IPN96_07195 [Anaerolineales bacterium]|nr:hypothetical protein [Anaerolineales bacterium]